MAKVDKLIIEGFKSFANKTIIPFYDGFNAIIGPNGSGKSNIVDALVFVLGKGSRSMRAQRMEHIIFNGGQGKKPSDYAFVELHINNKDRAIDIDEDYIIISRKVNRKGISYYKINGKTETRDKIHDILNKVGIDTDGMSIIQQGDITRVIEMKPKERRTIIDNAAGIKEYNEKEEKAKKELEEAEKNISEAKLLLEQKKELLDKIKKEREAALKYKELEERAGFLKAQLALSKLKSVEIEKQSISTNLEIKEKEYEALKSKIIDYDTKIEEKEEEINKLEEEIIEKSTNKQLRNEIEELNRRILERQGKINVHKRELQNIDEMIQKLINLSQAHQPNSVKNLEGVIQHEGTLSDIISVDEKFKTAIEVAAASHLNDVIVNTEKEAIIGINYLKDRKLGRTRFLPLDRLKPHSKSGKAEMASKMPGIIGFASDLIQYPAKYRNAIDYVFRDTLIAEDSNSAKRVRGVRIITLDGDLFEASGAIVGGTFKSRNKLSTINTSEIKDLERRKQRTYEEISRLEEEVIELNNLLNKKRAQEENESEEFKESREKTKQIRNELEKIKSERKTYYESMINLEVEIRNLQLKKARIDAEYDNYIENYERYKEQIEEKGIEKGDIDKIEKELRRIEVFLKNAGLINMKAIEEYEYYETDYNEFLKKLEKLREERESIENMIKQIEEKKIELFNNAFNHINQKFREIFKEVAEGEAHLELEEEGNIDSGLIIKAQPKGKKLLSIDSLSGGEKAITALSFLFAIQDYKPSPFYILDEVDAALDKENSEKVGNMIINNLSKSQFIVISHNDATVKQAQRVYGITMQKGVSKIFGVELEDNTFVKKKKSNNS